MGPSATAMPATPAQMAMARARSRGGNTLASSDSVAGITRAAPTPITARQAMSWLGVSDSAAASDPAPNTSRPMLSAPLRP